MNPRLAIIGLSGTRPRYTNRDNYITNPHQDVAKQDDVSFTQERPGVNKTAKRFSQPESTLTEVTNTHHDSEKHGVKVRSY